MRLHMLIRGLVCSVLYLSEYALIAYDRTPSRRKNADTLCACTYPVLSDGNHRLQASVLTGQEDIRRPHLSPRDQLSKYACAYGVHCTWSLLFQCTRLIMLSNAFSTTAQYVFSYKVFHAPLLQYPSLSASFLPSFGHLSCGCKNLVIDTDSRFTLILYFGFANTSVLLCSQVSCRRQNVLP